MRTSISPLLCAILDKYILSSDENIRSNQIQVNHPPHPLNTLMTLVKIQSYMTKNPVAKDHKSNRR